MVKERSDTIKIAERNCVHVHFFVMHMLHFNVDTKHWH